MRVLPETPGLLPNFRRVEFFITRSVAFYNNFRALLSPACNPYCITERIAPRQRSLLQSFPKIDLLILDEVQSITYPNYRIDHTVHLTAETYYKKYLDKSTLDSTWIFKPCKISRLISLVRYERNTENIFCVINHNLIYNRKRATIRSADSEILLTEQENLIFSAMLCSRENRISSSQIKETLLGYNPTSLSNAAGAYIQRLKHKLPCGLLRHDELGNYKLMIDNLY